MWSDLKLIVLRVFLCGELNPCPDIETSLLMNHDAVTRPHTSRCDHDSSRRRSRPSGSGRYQRRMNNVQECVGGADCKYNNCKNRQKKDRTHSSP